MKKLHIFLLDFWTWGPKKRSSTWNTFYSLPQSVKFWTIFWAYTRENAQQFQIFSETPPPPPKIGDWIRRWIHFAHIVVIFNLNEQLEIKAINLFSWKVCSLPSVISRSDYSIVTVWLIKTRKSLICISALWVSKNSLQVAEKRPFLWSFHFLD